MNRCCEYCGRCIGDISYNIGGYYLCSKSCAKEMVVELIDDLWEDILTAVGVVSDSRGDYIDSKIKQIKEER